MNRRSCMSDIDWYCLSMAAPLHRWMCFYICFEEDSLNRFTCVFTKATHTKIRIAYISIFCYIIILIKMRRHILQCSTKENENNNLTEIFVHQCLDRLAVHVMLSNLQGVLCWHEMQYSLSQQIEQKNTYIHMKYWLLTDLFDILCSFNNFQCLPLHFQIHGRSFSELFQ